MNESIATMVVGAHEAVTGTMNHVSAGSSKLFQSAKGRIKDWRRNREREKLERDLARIIETSNGHAAKGKPNGSPVFQQLVKTAEHKIESFCSKWNVDSAEIEAQVPALAELRARTVASKNTSPAVRMMAMFLGGGLSLALIGVAGGIIQTSHDMVIRLAHVVHLPF